jgi:hypothetical protein
MNTRDVSASKVGMAVVAASVLVLGLAVMPFAYQSAFANRTGIEGCTPGYWKTHLSAWEGGITVLVGGNLKVLTPDTLVKDAFDVEFLPQYDSYNSKTLAEALNLSGGGLDALLRTGVAALLNSSEIPGPIIDYSFTDDQVYDRVRDALDPQYVVNIASIADDNDTEEKKDILDAANNGEGGCPLN